MIVTINIPDAIAPSVVNNICAATGYVPKSGTKAEWAKRKVVEYIRQLNRSGASIIAGKAASASAATAEASNPIS